MPFAAEYLLASGVFLIRSLPATQEEPTPDDQCLRPATPDEIAETLSFALRYEGRRRVHDADTVMARITAERLVQHLERSGFVLMNKPPVPQPTASHHLSPGR